MLTEMEKLLEELSDTREDFCIVVEGKRDREALRELGIRRIVTLKDAKGLPELAEMLYNMGIRRAVILTDMDRRGEELNRSMRMLLLSMDIRVDERLRRRFYAIFGVKHVEDVKGGDVNGEDLRRFRKVPYKGKVRGKGHGRKARRHRSHFRSDRGSTRRGT